MAGVRNWRAKSWADAWAPLSSRWSAQVSSKLPVKQWVGKVNALPPRDRMALLAGGLALLVGVEFQAVLPAYDRRVALLASQQGVDPLQQQTDVQELKNKQAELAKLQQTMAQRAPIQAVSTQGGSSRDVFAALRKAMALQEVEVVSLKALPDEAPIKPPTHADAASAATAETAPPAEGASAAEVAAPAVASSTPPEPSVYRHRAELRLAGTLAHVNEVLQRFEQGNQLLRLERVKLNPAENDPRAVEATLSLVLISQEQTWLAM